MAETPASSGDKRAEPAGRVSRWARRERRRREAEDRKKAAAGLTPSQKLENLDFRLGPGVGAKKERARLAARLGG